MKLVSNLAPRTVATMGLLILSTALTPSAEAQSPCFLFDQLESAPCCAPVNLSVPAFGPGAMPATGLCWNACGLAGQNCISVDWDPIAPTPLCGHYVTKLRVTDCSGIVLMSGALELDYTRTWEETAVPGTVGTQVWRFAAKIDFGGSFTATPVCPVPPDLGPYPTSFWYGYFDVAEDCFAGTVENALVLFHNCDAFTHHPTLSSQPGTFHPTSTYAIVAPDTPGNPFLPTSAPLPGGPIVAEAMRRLDPSLPPGVCLAEEPVLQGGLIPIGSGCLCPLSLAPAQNTASTLFGNGVCGGSFLSLNFWPVAPWLDFTTASIGTWTTTASYPGPERVSAAEGVFLYRDVCDPTGVLAQSIDVFYGAVTQGGYLVLPTSPIAPTTDRFIDLASNYSHTLPAPVTFPVFGTVKPTKHLIYVNF
ncbi:hypothetical protein [Engelhardtia mirabilis]|uniref:Uncharacterized protein n=1 Tax=Engelhardtia mirabilis TaxID=2528011 RepID=A0A518BEM5_9BACT|nr:hypothetical protein Pla133_05020 [Planctomycetes bacterium Pla133]QDU99763.1 hypothetical protein Pla86_05020 [Planctomycetes bacterium Pla86]